MEGLAIYWNEVRDFLRLNQLPVPEVNVADAASLQWQLRELLVSHAHNPDFPPPNTSKELQNALGLRVCCYSKINE